MTTAARLFGTANGEVKHNQFLVTRNMTTNICFEMRYDLVVLVAEWFHCTYKDKLATDKGERQKRGLKSQIITRLYKTVRNQ
jgi:hypothetical protein